VVVALFTLRDPGTPPPGTEPVSFDQERAYADLRTLCEEFPQRVAGSDPDNRAAIWVEQTLRQAGLETHIDSVAANVGGREAALQNVWAVSPGDLPGTVMLVANRDVPPEATQGANDNASGVALLLELARVFTATAHRHTLLFLCTSGDAAGAVGSREFLRQHGGGDLLAVVALRDVARRGAAAVAVNGWSTAPRAAPPWLWLTVPPAARVNGNLPTRLPSAPAQVLRLAVPASAGSQAPFVAAGIPALTVSAAGGAAAPPAADTLDTVSSQTLARLGATVQAVVQALDGLQAPGEASGRTIFLTRHRALPGASLTLVVLALLVPLLAVTVDLFAHCRRERVPVRRAVLRSLLHLLPWLLLLAIVWLADLVGLLPRSPDAVVPPDSCLAREPQYARFAVLVAVLVAAVWYAVLVERRLERRVPTDPRAMVFVAHAVLSGLALLLALANPVSPLLVLPAAVCWPLARPGGWLRSLLPVYLGLAAIPVALVYYGTQLGLGGAVWWYFFLLLATRAIPAGVAVLAVVFLSTAGVLAHTLHERGLPPAALAWSAAGAPAPGSGPEDLAARALADVEPRRGRRRGRRERRGLTRRSDDGGGAGG